MNEMNGMNTNSNRYDTNPNRQQTYKHHTPYNVDKSSSTEIVSKHIHPTIPI